MNWLALVLVGGAAAWFEYNYQRSRRGKNPGALKTASSAASGSAPVERAGDAPSISPGAENDKKINTSA
jgi:hypothetical protein